jgi:protein-S-isoprenylcysteine O-methyltransferase Ste14
MTSADQRLAPRRTGAFFAGDLVLAVIGAPARSLGETPPAAYMTAQKRVAAHCNSLPRVNPARGVTFPARASRQSAHGTAAASDGRSMDKLYRKAAGKLLQLPLIVGALVFLPARTLDYWQGWLFLAVLFIGSAAITWDLAMRDPALLERRLKAGPGAERESGQKVAVLVAFLSLAAMPVLSAVDHRLGWSHVPAWAALLGNGLIAVAYAGCYFVLKTNTYSAATIQVIEGQTVVSTGPYAAVRHPMYSCGLLVMLGIPPALGSLWGLVLLLPAAAAILWRLLDEERFLARHLAGYTEYMRKVRYRLVPGVW